MNPESHPLDLLLDLVDGRLADEARRPVDAHLRGCAACQRELAALTSARQAAGQLPLPPLPAGLEARILAAIDAAERDATEPAVAPPAPPTPPTPTPAPADEPATSAAPGWPWWAVAGVAATILLAAVLWWRPATDLPTAAAAHVRAHNARQLAMTSDATAADVVQGYLAQRVAFPVRVFDLGMMGYTIAGASVLELGERSAAAWIYRNEAGSLLCEMFLGRLEELPPADETRTANDITFRIYHRDGGTQVFWAEGDVLCVLASTLPSDDVIQLAIAKAMKP